MKKLIVSLVFAVTILLSSVAYAATVEEVEPYVGKYVMVDFTDIFGFGTHVAMVKIIKLNVYTTEEDSFDNSITVITLQKVVDNIPLPLILKVTEIDIEDYR